ncbi:hydroxymethylbilane synthase [Alphaproteobacteria bacterium]|nr:hydroxymethylbilane synthase [Alphaproteobacteria bacterium]
MTATIRIATRGSPLALAQANEVRDRLTAAHPDLTVPGAIDITTYQTTGDRQQIGALSAIGGKGLFTKEIEDALLQGNAEIAVHSMKDVPTILPDGLVMAAYLPREDPRDAFIAHTATGLADLPYGATVGTASLRRKAILLSTRPDIRVALLRGNVETRLKKIQRGEMEATFLAAAGLKRLGLLDRARAILSPDDMLPAVCQGIIGIESREDDNATRSLLAAIDHSETSICVAAERAFLAALDGSCRTPIAGLATITEGTISLRGLIIRPDGSETLAAQSEGRVADASGLGRLLGEGLHDRAGPGFFDG